MIFTKVELPAPMEDWTGARIVIRSEDCPGGVAAIIGGAEEYASLIASAPDMYEALKIAEKFIDEELDVRRSSFLPGESPYIGEAEKALTSIAEALAKAVSK